MSNSTTAGCLREHKKDFDLEIVLSSLQRCLSSRALESDTRSSSDADAHHDPGFHNSRTRLLVTREYLNAFYELARFFKLVGPIFAFVARDLLSKIDIIDKHLHSPVAEKYTTVEDMILYEVSRSFLVGSGHMSSGTRAILRLHWALEFIIAFMDNLCTASHDTKTSKLVMDIYQSTLAHHHPWLTRKLAAVAVYTLPSIPHLIDIMCKQSYEEAVNILKEICCTGKQVLERMSSLFTAHGISHMD